VEYRNQINKCLLVSMIGTAAIPILGLLIFDKYLRHDEAGKVGAGAAADAKKYWFLTQDGIDGRKEETKRRYDYFSERFQSFSDLEIKVAREELRR